MSSPAYRRAGLACSAVAIIAAGIAAAWMVAGVLATEPDTPARAARIVAGLCLLVVELGALWLAAWLPAQQRRLKLILLALASAIAVLETGQIVLAQLAQHQQAAAVAAATHSEVAQLQASITRNAETITSLRQAAAVQATSKFPDSRASAAASLHLAAEIETRIASDRRHLAEREAVTASQANLAGLIGQGGVLAISLALAILISLAAALATHTAGHLIQQSRRPASRSKKQPKPRSTVKNQKSQQPAITPAKRRRYPQGVVDLDEHRKPAQGELFERSAA